MVFSFTSNFEFSAASISTICACSVGVLDGPAALSGAAGVLDTADYIDIGIFDAVRAGL
jgi:hypothetical protein